MKYLQLLVKWDTLKQGRVDIMKRHLSLLSVCLFIVSFISAQDDYATDGKITEALFIVQNKHKELNEYIGMLKKKLSDCFAQKKELEAQLCKVKNRRRMHREIEINACVFYQKQYPASIKELDGLAKKLSEIITELSEQKPLLKESIEQYVKFSFKVKEKIDTETKLLDLLLALEAELHQLTMKKSKPPLLGKQMHQLALTRLENKSEVLKKKINVLIEQLAKINEVIYKDKSENKETLLYHVRPYIA